MNAYDYDIVYKAGKMNGNANALSRNPVEQTVLIVQTRTRAGKLPPRSYSEKKAKKQDNLQNDLQKGIVIEAKDAPENTTAIPEAPQNDTNFESMFNHAPDNRYNENNEPKRYGKIFVECKDQLFMRKDNFLYSISSDGMPCDEESRQLLDRKELPRF